MAKFLEVIVTSVEEAIEAEMGGANRLELVRDLDLGGLTPSLEVVRLVLQAVRIPVRIMLRQSPNMRLEGAGDLHLLQNIAADASQAGVDGFVLGFLRETSQGKTLDWSAIEAVLLATRRLPVTFHRAFDDVTDPLSALLELKRCSHFDRILTVGAGGSWPERKTQLLEWQRLASPEIKLLVGAGLDARVFEDLAATDELQEVHVGRAARCPQSVSGAVKRTSVELLASMLR